jgi:hypothetical protein
VQKYFLSIVTGDEPKPFIFVIKFDFARWHNAPHLRYRDLTVALAALRMLSCEQSNGSPCSTL